MDNTLKNEDLRLNIIINGNQAQKELGDLERHTKDLKDANKSLIAEKKDLIKLGKQEEEEYKRITAEIDKNNLAIKSNEGRMAELRKEIGLAELSMKELRKEKNRLRQLLSMAIPGSEQWKKYRTELTAVETRLKELNSKVETSKFSFGKLADKVNRFAAIGVGAIAMLSGLAISVKNLISGNAKLSDSFADVSKTTDLTIEQVKDLYGELRNIDTRTSNQQLLQLAVEAGKLGITGSANIKKFVQEADKINVALGQDLGEDAIIQIGKLSNIFDVSMEKIGNVVNKLGASSAASEGFIVEFSTRLAGIAPNANIAYENVAGLASTLDSLGQTSELSATAVGQTFMAMFKKTGEFAKVAGMEVGDFSKLLAGDANAAFIKVLEGLKGNNSGMQEMAERMDSLGVDGARAIAVLGTLANNIETVKEQQSLATQEIVSGNSMLDEFNKKNQNMAANLEKIGKAVHSWFINSTFTSWLEKVTNKFAEWTNVKLSETLQRDRMELNSTIEVLKTGNVPLDMRKQLISEINDKYSQYLPRLLEEKDTMQDLLVIQRESNKEYEKQIAQQVAREKLQDKMEVWVDAQKEYMDKALEYGREQNRANKQLEEFNKKYSTKYSDYDQIKSIGRDAVYQNVLRLNPNLNMSQGSFGLELNRIMTAFGRANDIENQMNDISTKLTKAQDAYLNMNAELQEIISKQIGDATDKTKELEKLYNTLQDDFSSRLTGNVKLSADSINAIYDNAIIQAKGYSDIIAKIENLRQQDLLKGVDRTLEEERRKLKKLEDAIQKDADQLAESVKYKAPTLGTPIDPKSIIPRKEPTTQEYINDVKREALYQKAVAEFGLLTDEERKAKLLQQKKKDLEYIEFLENHEILSAEQIIQAKKVIEEDYQNWLADINKERLAQHLAEWEQRAQLATEYSARMSNIVGGIADLQQAKLDAIAEKEISDIERTATEKLHTVKEGSDEEERIINKRNLDIAESEQKLADAKKEMAKKTANLAMGLDIAMAISNGAVAVLKALADLGPIAGAIAGGLIGVETGVQIAQIVQQRNIVMQAKRGKYDVIGAEDGKLYNDVPYSRTATGLVKQPRLVSEDGAEIVVDSATTQRILTHSPSILDAINYYRVPQRASGDYKAMNNINIDYKHLEQLTKTVDMLRTVLDKGIIAHAVIDGEKGIITRTNDYNYILEQQRI